MQYDFATAIRIIFRPETGKDIADQKAAMDYLGLVTIGQSEERVVSLVECLKLGKDAVCFELVESFGGFI